jgi:hypothetical protein
MMATVAQLEEALANDHFESIAAFMKYCAGPLRTPRGLPRGRFPNTIAIVSRERLTGVIVGMGLVAHRSAMGLGERIG